MRLNNWLMCDGKIGNGYLKKLINNNTIFFRHWQMAAPHPCFRPIIFLNQQRRMITKVRLQIPFSEMKLKLKLESMKV
jgi:hypothetical protein